MFEFHFMNSTNKEKKLLNCSKEYFINAKEKERRRRKIT